MGRSYLWGSEYVTGGTVYSDGRPSEYHFSYAPRKRFKPTVILELRHNGITFTINNRYWNFFWKPYSPYMINQEGKAVKQGRFHFLYFKTKG